MILRALFIYMTLPLLDNRYKVNIGDEVRVNPVLNAAPGAADSEPRVGRIFGTVGNDLSRAGRNINEYLVEFEDGSSRRVKKSDLRPSYRSKERERANFMNSLDANEEGIADRITEMTRKGRGQARMQTAQRHIADIVISLFKWYDEFGILRARELRNLTDHEDEVCHLFTGHLNILHGRFAEAEHQQFFELEEGREWRVLQNVDELFGYMLQNSQVLFQTVPHDFTTSHLRDFMGHFLLWCESRQEEWVAGSQSRINVWTRANAMMNQFDPPTMYERYNGSHNRLGYMNRCIAKFKELDIIANLVT